MRQFGVLAGKGDWITILISAALASGLMFASAGILFAREDLVFDRSGAVVSALVAVVAALFAAIIAQISGGFLRLWTGNRAERSQPRGRLVVSIILSQAILGLIVIIQANSIVSQGLTAQLLEGVSSAKEECLEPSVACIQDQYNTGSVRGEDVVVRVGVHDRRATLRDAKGGAESASLVEGGNWMLPGAESTFIWATKDDTQQRPITLSLSAKKDSWQVFLAAVATCAIIASLIAIEVSVLLKARAMSSLVSIGQTTPSRPQALDYRLMRPAIFLFLFGIDLSMAFIPLYTESLFEPMFGLSKDVVMGLPISLEFLCVGIAILVAGAWYDRRGWQEPFYTGLFLAGVGGIFSWLAADAMQFILARGLVGFGYGLAQLSSHGFVIRNTDSKTKAQGLSHLAAGLYSGSICGAATGALMAEYFSYEFVFAISVVTIFSVVFYGIAVLGLGQKKSAAKPTDITSKTHARPGALQRYLTDRGVLAAVFFSSMPASIAVVGYLNYFSPVYLDREGIPESAIGQVLMLFGICLTLIGPIMGKLIDQTENKVSLILLGSLIGSVAFLSFAVWDGILAVAFSVLLLGISNCLVLSAQSVFVLNRDVSKELGEGKALAIFRSTSRIGQMLGPVVFAWIVMSGNAANGVVYFGLAYLCAVVLFVMVAGAAVVSQKVASEGS